MTKMSGAQALLESLEHQNVDVIFGILGGAILPVYDALCGNKKIRHILARHEQCAAHEAEGYARASGRAGVCMATSGPGATNLVTGIANAYMDSSPIIALTGQVPSSGVNTTYMIGRDAFQEADIIGITTAITKYSYQPRTVAEIPVVVNTAFYLATTGRPGPVLIDLPKNVQSGTAEVEFTDKIDVGGYKPVVEPNPAKISEAADLLAKAETTNHLGRRRSHNRRSIRRTNPDVRFADGASCHNLHGQRRIPRNPPLIIGKHRHARQPSCKQANG